MSNVGIAHHTSRVRGTWTCDHGTPSTIVDLVRELFGRIDLDLASAEKHNSLVGASEFYSAERPCPKEIKGVLPRVIYCNPPGPSENVRWFFNVWQRAVGKARNSGAFLIYNIDHWRMLVTLRPIWALVLRKRLRFVGNKHGANFSSVLLTTRKPPSGYGHIVRWEP